MTATLARPEIGDAVLQEVDRLRATRDFQIPVGVQLNERTGKMETVTRSLDEMLQEADDELEAANFLATCAVGGKEAA